MWTVSRPDGSTYMRVEVHGGMVEFKNFGPNNYTIRFDAKALQQLIPILERIRFYETM